MEQSSGVKSFRAQLPLTLFTISCGLSESAFFVHYLITNFNVLVLTDSEFPPVKRINIQNIQTKEIKRTIFDKRYQTSAIYLFSGETFFEEGEEEKKYDILHEITDAEYVFGLIERREELTQA